MLSNGTILNDLERPHIHIIKVTALFDAEYLRNGTTCGPAYSGMDLHTPFSRVSFLTILSDRE